jgi:hypothetical protein
MNAAFSPARSRLLRIGATLCLLAAEAIAEPALPRAVHTTDKNAYVQASFAKVRATPDANAATLAQVVTNTPVKLLAVQEDWCELEVLEQHLLTPPKEPNPANPPSIHGFIACRLLAAEPLTLAMVGAQLAANKLDAKARLNWQSRAFWIAPSLRRWAAVGLALESRHLTETLRNQEIETMQPLRPKAQEFEAMKQQLAAGIVVTPESHQEIQRQVLQQTQAQPQPMQHTEETPHTEEMEMPQSPMTQALQQIKFPEIKPSHFKKHEIPTVRPTHQFAQDDFWQRMSLVDALSADNGALFRADAISPAFFAAHPDLPRIADNFGGAFIKVGDYEYVIKGVWDVGGLRITFDGDALLHGVTASGEPTARNLKSIILCAGYNHAENNACGHAENSEKIDETSVAGYSTSPALVQWVGKPMPGGASAKARIKTRKLSLPNANEGDAATVHEIDLNRDGVADLLVLRNNANPEIGEFQWESIFANIGGQWRLLFQTEAEEEGC